MAATSNFETRIGCAGIDLDVVGGNFSSPTNLGKPNEDGVTVEYTAEYNKLKSGTTMGIREILKNAHELAFGCLLLEHRVRNMALTFGASMSAVVDNSGGSPPNEEFEIPDFQPATYYAIRLKVPQPQDMDLYDYFYGYRVAIIGGFSQVLKIGDRRFIKVRFECTEDPDNSDRLGKVVSEYDEGDLP